MSAVIYETGSLRVLGVCDGPDSKSDCPRSLPDGHVFCAGHDLLLTKEEVSSYCNGLERGRFNVAPMSICPLIGIGHGVPDKHAYFSPYACCQDCG